MVYFRKLDILYSPNSNHNPQVDEFHEYPLIIFKSAIHVVNKRTTFFKVMMCVSTKREKISKLIACQ